MSTRSLPILALGVLALAGCLDSDEVTKPSPIAYQEVLRVHYSCRSAPGWSLARTQAELEQFWPELVCDRDDPAPPPLEDEMALIYYMGERGTGGYWPEIAEVKHFAGEIRVVIVEHLPGPGCAVTQSFTQPAVVAVMPASKDPVRVYVSQRIESCQ